MSRKLKFYLSGVAAMLLLAVGLHQWLELRSRQRLVSALQSDQAQAQFLEIQQVIEERNKQYKLALQREGIAAEAALARIDATCQTDRDWGFLYTLNLKHATSAHYEQVAALLARHPELIPDALTVIRHKVPSYPLPRRDDFYQVPTFLPYVDAGRLLQLRTALALHTASSAEAFMALMDEFALGELFRNDPTEIAQVVRWKIHHGAFENLKRGVDHNIFDTHQRAALQNVITHLDYRTRAVQASWIRREIALAEIESIRTQPDVSLFPAYTDAESAVLSFLYKSGLGSGWAKMDAADSAVFLERAAIAMALPLDQALAEFQQLQSAVSRSSIVARRYLGSLRVYREDLAEVESVRDSALLSLRVEQKT